VINPGFVARRKPRKRMQLSGIQVDAGTRYHADNLPASFKESGLNVRVRFDLTGTQFTCGWNHKIPVIHIKSIER
jgi:hypothetical protein